MMQYFQENAKVQGEERQSSFPEGICLGWLGQMGIECV